jgi:hypothetical protein
MARHKFDPITGRLIETNDQSPNIITDPWDHIPGSIAILKTSNVVAGATVADSVPQTDPRPADPRPDGIGPAGAGLTHNLTGTDGSTADQSLAITTDQADYSPGSTATFTASNVAVGDAVQFSVAHLDPGPDGSVGTADDRLTHDLTGTTQPWTVTDGGTGDLDGLANGVITTSWYVNADAANQAFLLTAQEKTAGADGVIGTSDDAVVATATTTFTDSTLVDLTFQTTQTVNGAIFSTNIVSVGAGTGLLDPFSQVGGNTTSIQGYNTDFNDFVLDNAGKGGTNFIHSLKLSDLPIEFVNGIAYYRFELDINQLNSGDKILLSLNALQIWQAPVGDLSNYAPGATPDQGTGAFPPADNATLIYNLDAGGDRFIGLNGSLQSGSGNTTDMTTLVPVSLFDPNQLYVYLYSAFGYEPGTFNYNYTDGNGTVHTGTSAWTNNDGFEEWNRQIGQVIDGHKFNDLNANHVWDTATEPALAGWRVYLDFNNNNILDAGEPSVLTGTTDLNGDGDVTDANELGYYRFFVVPGTYTIREVLQSGWSQTAPNNAEGEFTVTLGEGGDAHNLDFGNTQGSIAWEKRTEAGVLQGGATFVINPDPSDGSGVMTVVDGGANDADTDAGQIQVSNVLLGTYTVTETQAPAGYALDDDPTRVVTVSASDLNAVIGTQATDDTGNTDESDFHNIPLQNQGLTPGFWCNHLYVWDAPLIGADNSNGNIDGNGVSLASKLAAAGVIVQPDIANLLPGNFDVDTVKDGPDAGTAPDPAPDGHKDLVFTGSCGDQFVIEWDDAREIVCGSFGTGGDKLGDFVRYAITTLLNDVGVPDFNAPANILTNIADWLINNAPKTDIDPDPNHETWVLKYNNLTEANNGNSSPQDGTKDGFPAGSTIKANGDAWQKASTITCDDGTHVVPSGSDIFAAMNGLTDSATNNALAVSADGSQVFLGNWLPGGYFEIEDQALNISGGYIAVLH